MIAKMDGTKNKHKCLMIEGYPTLLFFSAGDKSGQQTPLDIKRIAAGFIRNIPNTLHGQFVGAINFVKFGRRHASSTMPIKVLLGHLTFFGYVVSCYFLLWWIFLCQYFLYHIMFLIHCCVAGLGNVEFQPKVYRVVIL